MVTRQFPRPKDLLPLMQFKKPELNAKKRRLDRALTIYDLRDIAKRRTPKAAFDYTEGAAEGELSLSRARQAFEDIEFHPSILRDVSTVDTTTQILGGTSAMPFGIAPTGFTRLMQTEGEIAGAGAAAAAGIPFTLSTLGTSSIESVKAANPTGRNWFQLYVMREREISYGLAERAAAAGFDTLMFTVDTPVAGARLRDKRNGFSIPPQLTAGTIINAIPRPWWWYDFLTTPALEFASLSSTGGTVGELLDAAMDPSINFEDLAIIRAMWPGKIVVKGVQNLEDSKRLAALGVDGILLSNHGGRQLDRAPIPFHLLPEVAREVGNDVEVMVDTGIMNGADIVASMALGAKFTLIGRAYLYGLMAGGRQGVDRTIQILSEQIVRTMRLLEVTAVEELTPAHVTQLQRLAPRAVYSGAADAAAAVRAPSKSRASAGRPTPVAPATAAPATAKAGASRAANAAVTKKNPAAASAVTKTSTKTTRRPAAASAAAKAPAKATLAAAKAPAEVGTPTTTSAAKPSARAGSAAKPATTAPATKKATTTKPAAKATAVTASETKAAPVKKAPVVVATPATAKPATAETATTNPAAPKPAAARKPSA